MKILHDQGEKQKAEFLHEATMLKGLRHPNVVDYFGLAFSERDEVSRHSMLTAPWPCVLIRCIAWGIYVKGWDCTGSCTGV